MNFTSAINKKLSILYVFGGEKAQGAEIVIERLMHYNADKFITHLILSPGKFSTTLIEDQKPYLITTLDDLRKLNRTSGNRFKYYFKGISNYFSISFKIYRYIRKYKIDVVHANTMVVASYLLPALKLAKMVLPNVKWIWSDHDLGYFSSVDARLSKLCANVYDKTLAVSYATKAKFGTNNKVTVLYNGLDPQRFKADEQQRTAFRVGNRLSPDALIIGLAAKIIPDKGQLALAHVFNRLFKGRANVKLVFAGAYPPETPGYNEKVREIVRDSENICYLGYIDNVVQFFNGCDIVVNNSNYIRSEPLGTTIYEAMACQKIVVASAIGGTPEIIDNKINGYTFEPESDESLQEALSFVVDNYPALTDLRLAAREKVIKQFTVEAMAGSYNNILQAL